MLCCLCVCVCVSNELQGILQIFQTFHQSSPMLAMALSEVQKGIKNHLVNPPKSSKSRLLTARIRCIPSALHCHRPQHDVGTATFILRHARCPRCPWHWDHQRHSSCDQWWHQIVPPNSSAWKPAWALRVVIQGAFPPLLSKILLHYHTVKNKL